MRDQLKPLRIRLAIAGFLAIYVPLLVLVLVTLTAQAFEEDTIHSGPEGSESFSTSSSGFSWQLLAITVGLTAPIAGAASWWWSGRAIKPVADAMLIHEQLVEETSHELRTPLAILTNNAEVLLEHPDPSLDDYRAGLTRSLTTAQGMTRTIDELLVDARGRARTVVRKPTNLVQLVDKTTADLHSVASDAQVALVFHPASAISAPVDPASIDRAVSNLITNAIKVSPTGSTVSVAVSSQDDAMVDITVTDQGPGIDDDDKDRVFERYWQGSLSGGEGSGIGLDIVQQVAQAHGGEVKVQSPVADDHGTRFVLSLATGTGPLLSLDVLPSRQS